MIDELETQYGLLSKTTIFKQEGWLNMSKYTGRFMNEGLEENDDYKTKFTWGEIIALNEKYNVLAAYDYVEV